MTTTRLADELPRLTSTRGASLFPEEADSFFGAERVGDGAVLEPSFAILVVVDGEGTLEADGEEPVALHRGSTVLVPHAAGETRLRGRVQAIRCLPPASARARRSGRRP